MIPENQNKKKDKNQEELGRKCKTSDGQYQEHKSILEQ